MTKRQSTAVVTVDFDEDTYRCRGMRGCGWVGLDSERGESGNCPRCGHAGTNMQVLKEASY